MIARADQMIPETVRQVWQHLRQRIGWQGGTDTTTDDNDYIGGDTCPALPAITTPQVATITSADGIELLAGLTWEIATDPETPTLGKNAPPVLRLPTRRAVHPDAGSQPHGSLLLAMAAGLTPEVTGPVAFLAHLPGDAVWLALADIERLDGEDAPVLATPRPEPEGIYASGHAALAALKLHLDTTEIAGIAICRTSGSSGLGNLLADLAHIALGLPRHDISPGDLAAADLPLFIPPREVPVKLLGGIGAGAALVLTGFFVVLPLVQEMLKEPPPPPPELVRVQIAPGAFADACMSGLDAWWPRIVGWRRDGAGCALAGHLPKKPSLPNPNAPDAGHVGMVIWQHLLPGTGRNSVLARSAAEQILADWPHEARIDAGSITLWQTVTLPLAPVERDAATALTSGSIRDRLAALWADTPNAVSEIAGTYTVTLSQTEQPVALFARTGRVTDVDPVRFERRTDAHALVLAPVRVRSLPATIFARDTSTEATDP